MTSDFDPRLPAIRVTGRAETNRNEIWYRLQLIDGERSCTCVIELNRLGQSCEPLVAAARSLKFAVVKRDEDELIRRVGRAIDAARHHELPQFRVANNVGWIDDHTCFVTPSKIYGCADGLSPVDLHQLSPQASYARSGSLAEWQRPFRELLNSNPCFLAGACISLMPPLLSLLDLPGCLFEFTGEAATGKTTLLEFMGSVRGGRPAPGFQQSFRATPGTLERSAIEANDGLLLLDDVRSIRGNARHRAELLEEALYMFAGGRETNRLTNRDQNPRSFRTVVATSDNYSLFHLMAEGGVRYDASMSVRLIQIAIPADGGVLTHVPPGRNAADFIEQIQRDAHRFYGAPLHKFLKYLLRELQRDRRKLIRELKARIRRVRQRLLRQDAAQDQRVVRYFGMAYAAGSFAMEKGILRVDRDTLRASIGWLYDRHTSAMAEQRKTDPLCALRTHLLSLGSRVLDLDADRPSERESANAVAFRRVGKGGVELIFREPQFKQVLPAGMTTKRMCDLLKSRGLLVHDVGADNTTKNQTKRQLTKASKRERVYCIDERLLGKDR